MYLKMMGPEGLADSDSRKTFRVMAHVADVEFIRNAGREPCEASVLYDDGQRETFALTGNVYVLNDQGKTVSSFGIASAPEAKEA